MAFSATVVLFAFEPLRGSHAGRVRDVQPPGFFGSSVHSFSSVHNQQIHHTHYFILTIYHNLVLYEIRRPVVFLRVFDS